jgi:hypothetical protein
MRPWQSFSIRLATEEQAILDIVEKLNLEGIHSFFSTTDLASLFGVSKGTVAYYQKSGKIGYVREGKRIYYPYLQVVLFLIYQPCMILNSKERNKSQVYAV